MRICRESSLVCVFILVIRSGTNHNKGVRGRVVDLCKPTQRKYETAVSVILGRNVDAVVVECGLWGVGWRVVPGERVTVSSKL